MQASSATPENRSFPSEQLLGLAPLRLPNHRRIRYDADDLCVRMDQLAARDQTLVHGLYERLTKLLYLIADKTTSDAQKWDGVQSWVDEHNLDDVIEEARELGLATHAQDPGEELAKAMHDVRGGALSPLLGRLQLLGYLRTVPEALNILFVQARDHLKIMRNAIVGLDEARRDADRRPKAHTMQLMIDKWQESVVGPQWHERPVRLHIDCHYEGALTECCLESAAIDRIFYNLSANAGRYAVGKRLDMAIFPVPEPPGECLRFVLSNEISGDDTARLRAMVRTGGTGGNGTEAVLNLLPLFDPEVSTTGSGFGLTVVADFVARAFGLKDRAEALREGYTGALLDGQTFRVWFHWPMAHDDLPAKLDDYHHPEQSLSEP